MSWMEYKHSLVRGKIQTLTFLDVPTVNKLFHVRIEAKLVLRLNRLADTRVGDPFCCGFGSFLFTPLVRGKIQTLTFLDVPTGNKVFHIPKDLFLLGLVFFLCVDPLCKQM